MNTNPFPEKLGPYRLLGPLGRGGMGMVYRAVDSQEKEVAVKVLSPSIGGIEGFRERFSAEIASLERLRHPHIVRMYGYGEQEGHLFYAMELVPGDTLQTQISQGKKFSWQEAVRIGVEIASALKHAHDHGIVHRDIKPANLLVDSQGRIKLTDFGIAKLFGSTNLTVGGGVIGTADFMSPEQAEGEAATPRSDLYSLGGVLYALLAGRPPFRGRSIPEVIHKVRFDPPTPVGRLAENVPAELESIIDKLLAKDPHDRIPTPIALIKRLQNVKEDPPLDPVLSKTFREMPTGVLVSEKGVTQFGDEAVSQSETVLIPTGGDLGSHGAVVPLGKDSMRGLRGSFTPVEQSVSTSDDSGSQLTRGILAVGAFTVGIGLLLGSAWLFLRPASADQLYAELLASSELSDDGLPASQEDLRAFLARFPADARAPEVTAWLRSKELSKLERQFLNRLRFRTNSNPVTAIEELVGKALALESISPDSALRQFDMILSLYRDARSSEKLSRAERGCLELAEEKSKRLRQNASTRERIHRDIIEARLRSVKDKSPEERNALAESIEHLYGDAPWAADLVQAAKQLAEDQAKPPSESESMREAKPIP